MLRHLGYACLSRTLDECSPRGTILRNASADRLRALIAANLAGLRRVLEYNVEQRIALFRISSDVVPFGSHPVNTVVWWEEYAQTLADIGQLIHQHNLRVSMHPGQYTVLSSPDPRTLDAARADLEFHARLLDTLGLDHSHKLVIHVGGAYGDKSAALTRWVAVVRGLPANVRHRLVVENDERLFGAEDVLEASAAAGVPVVLDVLHHRVYCGPAADRTLPDLLRQAERTWSLARDGIQKIHYSSQAAVRRPGAHAEYVDPSEFAAFLAIAPADVEFDCMLEAKAKDAALLQVRDALGIAA